MPDTERRDHVIRERPPWMTEQITECGRIVADDPGITTITAEQLVWRIKREGQQRTAFTVCMTCWSTAQVRHRTSDPWADNPAGVLVRELQRRLPYDRDKPEVHTKARAARAAELHAIGQLIEAHSHEFDALVGAAYDAVRFRQRRAQQERTKRG